jgi:hypothetical protein
MRIAVGLSFSLLLGLTVIWLARRIFRHGNRWWKVAGILLVALAIVGFLFGDLPGSLLSAAGAFGRNSFLSNTKLITTFVVAWSSPWLILIGSIILTAGWWLSSRSKKPVRHRRIIASATGAGFLIVLAASLSFLSAGRVSETVNMEQTLIEILPQLANTRQGAKIEVPSVSTNTEKLGHISKQIMDNGLLRRDLIITGYLSESRHIPLEGEESVNSISERLPPDLYFYASSPHSERHAGELHPEVKAPTDRRFVPLDLNRHLLLDVLIGSSSIFPVYPSRRLPDLQVRSATGRYDVSIIDGGFAHNTPIEAAVSWGATHVIVVQASPPEDMPRTGNMLQNAVAAFNYLFSQAQTVDFYSKGSAEVYILHPKRPEENHGFSMGTFDFSPELINAAIHHGQQDAVSARPNFYRLPGEPYFVDEFDVERER